MTRFKVGDVVICCMGKQLKQIAAVRPETDAFVEHVKTSKKDNNWTPHYAYEKPNSHYIYEFKIQARLMTLAIKQAAKRKKKSK